MKEIGGWLLGAIIVVAAVLGISAIGLVWDRHAAPYQEETSRLTYKQSQEHIDGVAIQLDDLCRQYRNSTDKLEKDGLADTIRLRAAHEDIDNLPSQVATCVRGIN